MSEPPTPTAGRRASRSSDTREKLLEVAESRFAQRGYEGAHLESIAREVGVRKTALYYYFESKEALYVAVLERMLEGFDRAITGAVGGDAPPAEQALRLCDAVNSLLAEHRNYSQLLIRTFVDRVPVDSARLRPAIERVVGSLLEFHRRGVEQGAFRRSSARHFFTSLLGMAIFHYAGGDFSAVVLGVDDVFTHGAVAWRRREFRRLLLPGLLVDPSLAE